MADSTLPSLYLGRKSDHEYFAIIANANGVPMMTSKSLRTLPMKASAD